MNAGRADEASFRCNEIENFPISPGLNWRLLR